MTPQERLDYLLESVWVPTNALVTIGTIRDEIGFTPEQYGLVRGTLETAIATLKADADPIKKMQGIDLQDALAAMLSRGISLSSENRQATIDLLAAFGQWPDAVRDAVKALGGTNQPRWQTLGFEAEPTLESIQKQLLIEATRTAVNSRSTAIGAWLDTIKMTQSMEEIKAFIADLLTSDDGNPTQGGE
jgi:hypothetical protein